MTMLLTSFRLILSAEMEKMKGMTVGCFQQWWCSTYGKDLWRSIRKIFPGRKSLKLPASKLKPLNLVNLCWGLSIDPNANALNPDEAPKLKNKKQFAP